MNHHFEDPANGVSGAQDMVHFRLHLLFGCGIDAVQQHLILLAQRRNLVPRRRCTAAPRGQHEPHGCRPRCPTASTATWPWRLPPRGRSTRARRPAPAHSVHRENRTSARLPGRRGRAAAKPRLCASAGSPAPTGRTSVQFFQSRFSICMETGEPMVLPWRTPERMWARSCSMRIRPPRP